MARVLVVDDDVAIRELIALALEKSGHTVQRAGSAGQARTVVARTPVDAVVSDIYMSGETGLAFLEKLRGQAPNLPVILVTARGSGETAALAARIGAFEYVAKPFDVRQLAELVKSDEQFWARCLTSSTRLPASAVAGRYSAPSTSPHGASICPTLGPSAWRIWTHIQW